MQKGDIYTVFNEKSAKYKELTKILEENDHLMEWGPGERVLDVGCGPGDVTTNVILPRLAPDYSLLLGVDISPKMTQHGLAHYANDRVHFETLDIGLDITDFLQSEKYSKGFDKIFSFYVMNWVKDLEKGVSNLYRLLSPKGQALLMFPVNRHFQKTYKTISAREPWSQYFKDITRKISPYLTGENPCREFQNMLITAGFEVTKCHTKHHHDVFDSIDVLKGGGVGVFLVRGVSSLQASEANRSLAVALRTAYVQEWQKINYELATLRLCFKNCLMKNELGKVKMKTSSMSAITCNSCNMMSDDE